MRHSKNLYQLDGFNFYLNRDIYDTHVSKKLIMIFSIRFSCSFHKHNLSSVWMCNWSIR